MRLASAKEGVESLVLVDPAVLRDQDYLADDIHLNSEGAAIFTSAVATYLPRQLESQSVGSLNERELFSM